MKQTHPLQELVYGFYTKRGPRRSEIFMYCLDGLRLQIQLSSQALKSTGLAFHLDNLQVIVRHFSKTAIVFYYLIDVFCNLSFKPTYRKNTV